MLSEGAASLLPDGPRPAVVFTVRIDPAGGARIDGVERAIVRNAAKLAYDSVRDVDLPPEFAEFARRVAAAGERRGAVRLDPPEQEVSATPGGGYTLSYRPRLVSEERNAALSLACNLAVAAMLQAHGTGLFRVQAAPDAKAVARLRQTAAALGVAWPEAMPLAEIERGLNGADPRQAALMTAIRRAGGGAGYQPYRAGVVPWHAAMAGTYAHATAPLRRLADRYVVEAALAVANGRAVPGRVAAAFERLPAAMARADALAGRIDRAVIDLAEAVMLAPRVGERFAAVVLEVDERGARVQLRDVPVVARLATRDLVPGAALDVRVTAADPERRLIAVAPAP